MLYGMNHDDHEEYGLIERKKLNIKKVLLFLGIVFLCFLIMFGSFYISYTNMMKKNTEISETKVVENNNKEKLKNNKKGSYEGNHTQIPSHDLEKIATKFVPEFNINGQQEIKNIYYSQEKQVYLTFDDGPSKDITPQILDILKDNNVKANFFVLGARVELYPETLKRIFNEGHYIANHGYSHKYSKIYESKDTVFQEYIECENAIKKALNNQDYNSYLFRFPGGSTGGKYSKIKAEARELLSSYGVAFTNWNCLTGDAEGKNTKEECIAEFINTKSTQNGLIVLMHDANDKQQTVESLSEIIQYLKNEGYQFKTFYDIF